MKKETPEPIHISPSLKDFIVYMKAKLKRKNKMFYSVPKTLAYYLADSNKFVKDYSKYCEMFEVENEIFPTNNKVSETIKIMEYEDKDVLSLLNK